MRMMVRGMIVMMIIWVKPKPTKQLLQIMQRNRKGKWQGRGKKVAEFALKKRERKFSIHLLSCLTLSIHMSVCNIMFCSFKVKVERVYIQKRKTFVWFLVFVLVFFWRRYKVENFPYIYFATVFIWNFGVLECNMRNGYTVL